MFDSTKDTLSHIRRVGELLSDCVKQLTLRAARHDHSKLQQPEKPHFDKAQKLDEVTYGSDEYERLLNQLKPALQHHYKNNSHHPQHYPDGIVGMDLFDLLEMFMDWKAASERHNDGNIYNSITHNAERFGIDSQLVNILWNTANRMDWEDEPS